MAKEVDILSYWMPVLRNLKEFKEIAKVEEAELRRILEAVEQTLANMFIETANEEGIKRFEKMLNIIPSAEEDISTRRFRVLSKWNNKEIYTDNTLEELLASFCGEGNYKIVRKYNEYIINIVTNLSIRDAFEAVAEMLRDLLPCNMILELSNQIHIKGYATAYVGGVVSTTLCYEIGVQPVETHIRVELPLYYGITNSVGIMTKIDTE